MQDQSTHDEPEGTTDHRVIPVGSTGRVTTVTDGATTYLICRTVRGRGGWGVHCAAGELITSGWPTLTRARAYADRLLSKKAGAAG
ncbi:hypothetical protein [Streptomyces sp. ISL-100]|uniref:hypothetical protein n=1 Tax=Streptomyces sp. ISL-100 TaxID=2819173 RepID=UPI001BEAA1CD|nr:hypothetical protein [Streptomyces sp. ISL-100]MBT2395938.1 hypothetical protein [Streptomyces sp. ISL-100]